MKVVKYKDAPMGCTFTVVKEQGKGYPPSESCDPSSRGTERKSAPLFPFGTNLKARGRWTKMGASHATMYHGITDIILDAEDLVQVIPNRVH